MNRRASFEPLETRNLLSVTLPTIANQTVLAGAPLNLALSSTGTTDAISYSVSVNNSNVTASIAPSTNTFLKLQVDDTTDNIHGVMVFELFNDLAPNTVAQIMTLVNSHFYDGLTFHRILSSFMIQGGGYNASGTYQDPGVKFDDEINKDLQFTSSGLLAMANSGSDTNTSQFFITAAPTALLRNLDFRYTIFGKLVEGESIRQQIAAVPVHMASGGIDDQPSAPDNTVTITSATIITPNVDGVLRLSTSATSGTSVVTVTARDMVTNETSVQQFTVTAAADTVNDPPFLGSISPIQTTVGTAKQITIPATDVEGDPIYYKVTSSNDNLVVSVGLNTGVLTITPNASLAAGVYYVTVKVAASDSTNASADSQVVPVYVLPTTPTAIKLLPDFDSGINNDGVTNLNNTSGKTLQFQVDGVTPGIPVQLYSDGTLIGEATATGTSTSVVITTNGTVTLTDGTHNITAKQILKNVGTKVGNFQTPTNLTSDTPTAIPITIDTVTPQLSFTPVSKASANILYHCLAAVTNFSTAGTLTFTLPVAPSGMAIDANGMITWTPGASQSTPVSVTVKVSDVAGNSSQQSWTIDLVAANSAPQLVAASPSLGTTNEDTAISIPLTGTFINNGANTTQITDADSGNALGGIAITGITGRGTWEYTLDGSTFHAIASVSDSSALTLPKTATLRYTPDGQNADTATITYHAWDASDFQPGGRADLSQDVLVGNHTAFSSAKDTATLTVTAVNDAPVLTPNQPKLGNLDYHSTKDINVSDFINNGTGTTTVTDVDTGATIGGIAIFGFTGNGWSYSLDGTTYTALSNVSLTSALLLPKTAKLRYTPPSGVVSETADISYRAWDTTTGNAGDKVDISTNGTTTAFSFLSDKASLTVLDVNDAPVLTPASPSLGTTTEDTSITIPLTGSFINNNTGTTTITDPDTNPVIGGIALIGVTGNGKWEYTLDGTTFTSVGTVSGSSALLLPKTASLRYTPDGKNGESATIIYRAWDTTSGSPAGRADLSQSTALGGTTAFSLATDTATLTVSSVNDAPVLVAAHPSLGTITIGESKTFPLTGTFINFNSGSTVITDPDTGAEIGGIALIGIAGSGTWEYSTDGTTWTAVGTISSSSALLLKKTCSLRYTSNGSVNDTPSITYRAWDTTTGTNGSKVDLSADSAVGGVTAFSSATDSAALTVAGGSLSGYVYIDTNNDGLRSIPNGGTHWGLPGVPVKLLKQDSSNNWVEVAGKSPVLTGADGSYHFDNLVAGTYRIQETQPSNYVDGKSSAGTLSGSTTGTAGTNTIDVTLGNGGVGTEYNFGELGLRPEKISLRMFLASSPIDVQQAVNQVNVAPTIDLAASQAGTGYSTQVKSNGASVAVTATDATVADSDSPMLASMTFTLTNPQDGSSEILSADVSNTSITANYVNGILTLSGAADLATYQKVLRTVTYKNTAASPHSGDRTISVVANDGITNSLTAVATVTVTSGPSGYSIAANDSTLNAAKAASTGFTFAGAIVGATYKYTITSSGGSGSLTGSGTITSATQQVTGINVSSLPNGTLTYSVTLTDSSGSAGSATTSTATLDKTAPTGYSITLIDSSINATDAANTGFNFLGAELGTTYSYTVTSSGGGSKTGTGTITSATQQITGIDVSSLSEGTLTYSVTLTDAAGNAGTAATATATYDKTAPAGYTITADDNFVNSTKSTSVSFTFAGAVVGTTYHYTISTPGSTPVTGTGTITSTTQKIGNIDVSSLSDGAITYSVTLADAAGNVGTAATATAKLDRTKPAGYSIIVGSNINAAQASNVSFSIASAETGTTYNYMITGPQGTTPKTGTGTISSATQQITGIDLSSWTDGDVTISVTLTDAAGNVGSAVTTVAKLDKVAPAGYSITTSPNVSAAQATNVSFTFVAAEVGATYHYTVTSHDGTFSKSGSGTIATATDKIDGIDVSTWTDGELTFSVTLTDAAGNAGNAVIAHSTLDKAKPAGYSITTGATINAAQASNVSFTFAGAEIGTTYNYTISGPQGTTPKTGTGTISSATQQISGIDLSSWADGDISFSVTLADTAGNVGTAATATAKLDKTAPPAFTIAAPAAAINSSTVHAAAITLANAEVGTHYSLIVSSGSQQTAPMTGTIASADQQITGIDVSSLPDGTLTFTLTLTDTAGNSTIATDTATLDKTPPAAFTIGVTPKSINAGAASTTSIVLANVEVGTTYSLVVKSESGQQLDPFTGTIVAGQTSIDGINVFSLPDGTLTYTLTLTDAAGNSTSAFDTAHLDKTAPAGYSISPDRNSLPPVEATNVIFTFAGAEKDATFSFTLKDNGGTHIVTHTGTIQSPTDQLPGIDLSTWPVGEYTYSVTLTDPFGNVGNTVTGILTLDLDTTPPAGYSITTGNYINAAEKSNASFKFAGAEVGTTYNYTVKSHDGSATKTGTGTITDPAQVISGIDVSSFPEGQIDFSVTLTDKSGNVGVPATAAATLDTIAPAGYSITVTPNAILATDAPIVTLVFADAVVGTHYSITIASDGGPEKITLNDPSNQITSQNQSISNIDLSSLSSGHLTFTVTLIDDAGNVGPEATASISYQKSAPALADLALQETENWLPSI